MVPHTRRRSVRRAMSTECMVESEDGRRLVGDQVLDLSWTGLLVRGLAGARVGEKVRASVRIPGSNLWLSGHGFVARVDEGRRSGERGARLGVHLTRMDGMSRVLLASVLREYPEVTPERGGARDYARIVARIAAEG